VTFIVKLSPPGAGEFVTTTAQQSTCADMKAQLTFASELITQQTKAAITMTNNGGPDVAQNAKSVTTFSGAAGMKIDTVRLQACSGGGFSTAGLTVTVTKPSLALNESCDAIVSFALMSGELVRGGVSGTAAAISDTPDPRPKNNVATSAAGNFDAFGRGTVAKDPDLSVIVISPVVRGK
jgi:hypothetical protein